MTKEHKEVMPTESTLGQTTSDIAGVASAQTRSELRAEAERRCKMDELYGGSMAMLKQAQEQPSRYIPPTRRQQLMQKKDQLETMLTIVNKAIAALDAHPDLEEFAETLARAL